MTDATPNQTAPTHHPTLEPLSPAEGRSLYLESRSDELADRSLELHEKHITSFVTWCRENGIENMNEVTARSVHEYRLSIREGFAQSTLSIYLSTVRQFVRFCESIDGVGGGVAEKIVLPDRDRTARSETLEADDATAILSYLRKYHYGSRTHALMALLWHTGIRTGTVQALDVSDHQHERERLRVRHRPETDTPLKNGENAERYIALSAEVSEILADYVSEVRHSVTDEYDREPLFTSKGGRPSKNTIRRNIYAATRPCSTGRGCPHNRDPDTCEAAGRTNAASKCLSTVSGHPVRRGAITHHLRQDVPEKVVSDRMNVSQSILERHYDQRTEDEKTEQRRQFLSNI
ncbi:tyrosine-type recombinase/integrase [Halomarina oriensis]|uniref:Tyrosine-type recombinase/integrase n=1 Tax=Halomarina oriensis TaxID=671145 RepID=A0A6B0GEM5_9EURY|nr:site-specific integrase [Halomarina oriensis]MWG32990.1 tyrosine-type recombinase/integrase [Halomarina oriensis]